MKNKVFISAWSIALLFQCISNLYFQTEYVSGRITTSSIELAVFIQALFLFFKPESLRCILSLSLTQIANTIICLPEVPNHRLITAFINLFLIFNLIGVKFSKKDFLANCSGDIRALLVLFYFFVTFHKLNYGFLDHENSCATKFYLHVHEQFSFLPTNEIFLISLPYQILFIEGLFVILFYLPTMWFYAVFIGMLFHFCLALDLEKHFFDFSSTMFAIYLLFIPDNIWSNFKSSPVVVPRLLKRLFAGSIVTCLLLGLFFRLGDDIYFIYYHYGRYFIWMTYGVFYIMIFYFVFIKYRTKHAEHSVITRTGIVLIVLLVINGVLPYLGIKHRSSWDMYSNLKIIGHNSNSFVVPFTLDIFNMTNELVTVTSTSDTNLSTMLSKQEIPLFELLREAKKRSITEMTITWNGNNYDLEDILKENNYMPWLPSKLFWFRAVDIDNRSRCKW